MSRSSLPLFSIGRGYTLHLASLGKDPNSKCKVRFLLSVCCFCITIKVKKKSQVEPLWVGGSLCAPFKDEVLDSPGGDGEASGYWLWTQTARPQSVCSTVMWQGTRKQQSQGGFLNKLGHNQNEKGPQTGGVELHKHGGESGHEQRAQAGTKHSKPARKRVRKKETYLTVSKCLKNNIFVSHWRMGSNVLSFTVIMKNECAL